MCFSWMKIILSRPSGIVNDFAAMYFQEAQAAYSHEDKAPGTGRGCLYKLEEIDLAGKTSWHGPVSVKGLALCGTMTADSSGFRQKLSVLSRSWALGVLFLPAAAVILGLRRRCRAL